MDPDKLIAARAAAIAAGPNIQLQLVQSVRSLCALSSVAPHGSVIDEAHSRIVIPVPQLGRSVFLGVEYDYLGNGVDIKLYDTAAPGSADDLFLDITWSQKNAHIRRREYSAMHYPLPSHERGVFEELRCGEGAGWCSGGVEGGIGVKVVGGWSGGGIGVYYSWMLA